MLKKKKKKKKSLFFLANPKNKSYLCRKKMGEFDLDSGCKFSLDGGSKSKSKTNTEQQEPERLANKRRVTMCEIHTDKYLFRRAFSEVQLHNIFDRVELCEH